MHRILPYLRLCRLPTVFTAMADIFLGFLLVHESLRPAGEFAGLLIASSALYLSGMVFNDIADRHKDAEERENRPIPSGAVTLKQATLFSIALMGTGLVAAGLVSLPSLSAAVALAACILLYDFWAKRTLLGPVAMGGCRFLNVILGASLASTTLPDLWTLPQVWVAAGMGVYIVGLTWFARTEARVSSRISLLGAMAMVNVGLAILLGFVARWPGEADRTMVFFALAVVLLTINRRLAAAVLDPSPLKVQTSIKTMILSIIMLDAVLIFFQLGTAGASLAIATAALLIPAMLLGRWIRMT